MGRILSSGSMTSTPASYAAPRQKIDYQRLSLADIHDAVVAEIGKYSHAAFSHHIGVMFASPATGMPGYRRRAEISCVLKFISFIEMRRPLLPPLAGRVCALDYRDRAPIRQYHDDGAWMPDAQRCHANRLDRYFSLSK